MKTPIRNRVLIVAFIAVSVILAFTAYWYFLVDKCGGCSENPVDKDAIPCTFTPTSEFTHDVDIFAVHKINRRIITTTCIPEHLTGNYTGEIVIPGDQVMGQQKKFFSMPLVPAGKSSNYPVSIVTPDGDPEYIFGITLTGIEMDPAAADWYDYDEAHHSGSKDWAYEASNNLGYLGLDCNVAHVQPDSSYHYHGVPAGMSTSSADGKMILYGYAADGYPVYYKYGFKSTGDKSELSLVELKSSWRLKHGCRQDEDPDAPCGPYNGKFVKDYEYVSGLGDLDSCNGYYGFINDKTATYYYVITDNFPLIPRCFYGDPDESFSAK